MLVRLIGKNSMHKVVLPQIAVGNYWISNKDGENDKKLLNIEGKDDNWQVVSNNYVKIINSKCVKLNRDNIEIEQSNDCIVNKIILKQYSMHFIYLENYQELYILYCSPFYENDFVHLDMKNIKEISIGSGIQNHIVYNNILIQNKHARILFSNNRWMVESFNTKFGIFVNDELVTKTRILSNGDVIFILGLKIVIMGNTIFMNNPLNKIQYNKDNLILMKLKNNYPNLDLPEINDIDIYSEDDYFTRAPRITNLIECEKVNIDAPPAIQSKEEMPLILVLGSMLSMGAMMMISVTRSLDGLMSGNGNTKETIFSLIMSVIMLISMTLFPMLSVKYERKQKVRYEEKRQKRYKDYINSKSKLIDKIMNKQRNILIENYVPAEKCVDIILNKNSRLWERKIEDHDFLEIRLGIGDVPLKIDIQYPEEKFVMEDDNLVEILNTIANKSKILKDAPIVVPLIEKNISAIITHNDEQCYNFLQNIIIQLITFQSYKDLKIIFLVKEDKQKKWDYLKMLPHIWDDAEQIRFFADDYNDMQEISKYLEEEFQNRVQYEKEVDYKSFMPYYLIITDDYKKVKNLKIVTEILKSKTNLGFSILCISDNLMQLPDECKTFISIENGSGIVFESELSSTNQRKFTFDITQTFFFDKIIRTIANIPIKNTSVDKTLLPNTYTFLEMYDVGSIDQLNILERWRKNDSTLSLQAPLGIDNSEMPIVLDIHEKFHGPHGLIAGSTGSGKSEFIITYILSLAINYHPDDVSFLLIDYKGGGLAGAFKKREAVLPHLVGTITNIDTAQLQRSLASIQSELRRRQIIFNEARNVTDESTIDIYKYQKLYHEGVVSVPIPHLLIICDEFAELKQQQEEFMDELISVARIGRSLGVHLILATQKPAGIVNEQIRSNSKFAICLKVQDRSDSNDVIKKPDAANLKQAGQFYLQVGNDEYFVLGQSAWAGAPYFPSNFTKKKVDNSVEFISNIGMAIKKVDNSKQEVVSSQGDQLTNIVRYIYELAQQENIQTKSLWLDNIPETIFVRDLHKKYNIQVQKNKINPVIGEYDDPFNQRQGIVNLDLSSEGNTIIYGNADSGKETLLSTIIYDIITTHTVEEVQLYLLDFGSEALKIFSNSPHVGDIVFIDDDEKISRLFELLQKIIKDRKAILSEYNGDYNLYIDTSGKDMPMIVVIINNYEVFSENYEDNYEEEFRTLTREGIKCGITFIISTSAYSNIRYRLSQNFKQKIALQLNNDDDYINIFDRIGKKRLPHIFGRGFITLDEGIIYEFQTAKICEATEWNTHINNINEQLNKINKTRAMSIPILPDRVTTDLVSSSFKDMSAVPVGIVKKTLHIATYDFKKQLLNIITSKNIEHATQFVLYILEEIKNLRNDVDINLFDAERLISNKKTDLKCEYIDFISSLDSKKDKERLCVIVGIDKFVNDFDNIDNNFSETFYSTLKKAEIKDNCNFIIVDNTTRLKNHEYDEWYKNYITKEDGIWVGDGVNNQYLINLSETGRDIINNCGSNFGYVIKEGKPTLIKLLGMKEKGEEDE